jgi:hypothetical protein
MTCKRLLAIGLSEMTKIARYGVLFWRGENVTEPHGQYRAPRVASGPLGSGTGSYSRGGPGHGSRRGRFLVLEGNADLSTFEIR